MVCERGKYIDGVSTILPISITPDLDHTSGPPDHLAQKKPRRLAAAPQLAPSFHPDGGLKPPGIARTLLCYSVSHPASIPPSTISLRARATSGLTPSAWFGPLPSLAPRATELATAFKDTSHALVTDSQQGPRDYVLNDLTFRQLSDRSILGVK